jgi:hypothetical protein
MTGVTLCNPGMFSPKLCFPLALIGLALAMPHAKAAVTITFSYNGTDTVGVISGSIILPAAPAANDVGGGFLRYVGRGEAILYVHVVGSPSYDHYTGGSNPGFVNLLQYPAPQFIGTKSFGFDRGSLYTAFDAVPGSTYAPTGTFVWPGFTLEQVGVSGLATPLVVYVASNGEEIRFLANVPEPGVSGLLAVCALGTIGIRRRGR